MSVAGKRILIFGDSLSHPGSDSSPEQFDYQMPIVSSAPGAVLAGKLLAYGAKAVRTDARVGRSAMNFWSRERYSELLASDLAWQPSMVIVMLGTNDLSLSPKADAQAMAGIRDVFITHGAEVWAIGPPAFASADLTAKTDAVMGSLRTVFGADHVIDARPLTADLTTTGRARDGVHFTPDGAEVFGARLAQVFTLQAGKVPIGVSITLGLAVSFFLIFASMLWTRRNQ